MDILRLDGATRRPKPFSIVNLMIDIAKHSVDCKSMTDGRDTYLLHRRLGWRVSRLARILQSRLEAVLADEGLTRLMWVVLCGLGEDGVETPSDMADYIGITRASTSRLLTTMEGRGLIRRHGPTGSDGRQVALALTDRGRAILTRYRPQADAMTRHFLDKITPDQARLLMDALATLAEGEGEGLTRL
jgi:MarR family transcriptional regulator, transcriptional regulator for hemolysin